MKKIRTLWKLVFLLPAAILCSYVLMSCAGIPDIQGEFANVSFLKVDSSANPSDRQEYIYEYKFQFRNQYNRVDEISVFSTRRYYFAPGLTLPAVVITKLR
jgi:hypothetical protein